MADPRIVSYLKQYGQRFSPDQLRRSLLADGWPEGEVEAALAEVGLSKPPPLPFEQRWAQAAEQRSAMPDVSGARPLARGHPPLETQWRPLSERAAAYAAKPAAGAAPIGEALRRPAPRNEGPRKRSLLHRLLHQ